MLSGSALARVLLLIALAAGLIGFTRPYWAADPGPQAVSAPVAPAAPRRTEPQPAAQPATVSAPQRPVASPAAVSRVAPTEPGSLFEVTPASREAPASSEQAAPPEAPPTRQVAAADDSVIPRGVDLVDLNTGSLAALNALKGGGAVGRTIVQHRPYGAVDQLVSKRVLSRAVYQRVKDQVTVR